MKHKSILNMFFIIIIFCDLKIYSRENVSEHILEGNLSLPASQQPGPLFCFGQTVIDKGDLQGYIFGNSINGNNRSFNDVIPYFIYGVTNNFSVTAALPIAAKYKDNSFCSSGIEDLYVQLEYAFHNKDCSDYGNQATVVTALSLPTGSTKKDPNTGLGSPSFFFGLTASHLSIDWYVFGSPGIIFTSGKAHKDIGEIFYYQFGVGRNLSYISSKKIITLIIEFFGATNTKKNSTIPTTTINKNLITSGFYIGPSLWVATQRFIFNIGIAFSVSSNKKNPNKLKSFFAAEIGYKFN